MSLYAELYETGLTFEKKYKEQEIQTQKNMQEKMKTDTELIYKNYIVPTLKKVASLPHIAISKKFSFVFKIHNDNSVSLLEKICFNKKTKRDYYSYKFSNLIDFNYLKKLLLEDEFYLTEEKISCADTRTGKYLTTNTKLTISWNKEENDKAKSNLIKIDFNKPQSYTKVNPNDRHISKGLRYDILKRDNFKCQICGRTAEEDGVKLHVDHVIPFSKGGKTIPENLRTLCQDCNLGKSNKLEIFTE